MGNVYEKFCILPISIENREVYIIQEEIEEKMSMNITWFITPEQLSKNWHFSGRVKKGVT